MIEVEKKFVASADNLAKLTDGAKFLGMKSFTDDYYDDKNYSLAHKDFWLRTRDGRWELKLPFNDTKPKERVSEQYREIEDEQGIIASLGFDEDKSLLESLEAGGFKPFATITTHRKKYEKDGFAIDVDSATFGYEII